MRALILKNGTGNLEGNRTCTICRTTYLELSRVDGNRSCCLLPLSPSSCSPAALHDPRTTQKHNTIQSAEIQIMHD